MFQYIQLSSYARLTYLLCLIDHILDYSLNPLELRAHLGTCTHGSDCLVQACLFLWIGEKPISDSFGSFRFSPLFELEIRAQESGYCERMYSQ
jgi:hypothetical protein